MNTLSNLIATYTSLGFWGSNLTSVAGQGVVPGLGRRPHLNVATAYCVHEMPPSGLPQTVLRCIARDKRWVGTAAAYAGASGGEQDGRVLRRIDRQLGENG